MMDVESHEWKNERIDDLKMQVDHLEYAAEQTATASASFVLKLGLGIALFIGAASVMVDIWAASQ